MPPNMDCPRCGSNMRSRGMLDHYGFKPYRICPDCHGKYTTDVGTKRRAGLATVFAIFTLALSAISWFEGFPWGFAAASSGLALLIYVGYTLSKLTFVEYRD